MAMDESATELTQGRLGPLMFGHFSTGCRHLHDGASPPGMHTFALLADTAQTVRWCGQLLDGARMPYFQPGQDFSASAGPRFSVYTLSVDPAWLEGQPSWGRFHEESGRRRLLEVCDPRAASGLRGTVSLALDSFTRAPFEREGGDVLDSRIADDVLSHLAAVIEDASPVLETVPAAVRARAVREAAAYIRARQREALSAAELCAVAKVSERTLRRAFLEHLGMTPRAYHAELRLNGVRHDLLRHPSPEVQVSDVANRWGFWHLGQFARDYKRFFGELPSDTLATGARRRPSR
jgi:AraC family ethanolamine operon transcriptional activator